MQAIGDPGMQTLTINNTGGTDHLSFIGVGLPGFQFIQDPLDYGNVTHHTNQDVYERLQPDDMKFNAAAVARSPGWPRSATRNYRGRRNPVRFRPGGAVGAGSNADSWARPSRPAKLPGQASARPPGIAGVTPADQALMGCAVRLPNGQSAQVQTSGC